MKRKAGALTSWITYREGKVRKRKDNNEGTHSLKSALGGTSEDTERK
jgi:hypothetical protein